MQRGPGVKRPFLTAPVVETYAELIVDRLFTEIDFIHNNCN